MGLLLEGMTGALSAPVIWSLGVVLTCVVVGVIVRVVRRRRGRLGAFGSGAFGRPGVESEAPGNPEVDATRREVERLEGGLREFAREVEERLDSKLDRLELLVREADRVLKGLDQHVPASDNDGGPAAPSSGAPSSGARAETRRRDPLDAITSTERERVLTMNREGLAPEAIAEATALRRGEVDLILRLEEISQRSRTA